MIEPHASVATKGQWGLVAAALAAALADGTRHAFERLLTEDVHWHGEHGGPECHTRAEAGEVYAGLLATGASVSLADLVVHDAVMTARLRLTSTDADAVPDEVTVRLTLRDGRIAEIVQLDAAPLIELLYFDGCPNYEAFLPQLRQLLADHAIAAPIILVHVETDHDAQRRRFLGSPTVRVNGHDVEPGADERDTYGLQCRVYSTPDGQTGQPADRWILDALIGDPVAVAAVDAVRQGDLATLRRLLDDHPDLAAARLPQHGGRTLLHIATDWPGHLPNVAATIRALVDAGADPDAPGPGPHPETPLHWAASSNDIEALDALLDAGANPDAPGAVIAGGPPLADATAFGQWEAARRLVERGAQVGLWEAAALGLLPRLRQHLAEGTCTAERITSGFWGACHGGQAETASLLLEHGADINWVGYDNLTPLDAARRSQADHLVPWLLRHGAKTAADVR